MFGIGAPEAIIIAVLALIIFGPERLPEIAAQAGKMIRDFRRMSDDVTSEFTRTMTLDAPPPAATLDPDPVLTNETIAPSATPNGMQDVIAGALQGQTIAPDVITAGNGIAAEEASLPAGTDGVAGAELDGAGDGGATAAAPFATKADSLAGVSALDEAPPAESPAVAERAPDEGEAYVYKPTPLADTGAVVDLSREPIATGEADAVRSLPADSPAYSSAEAWHAVTTTDLTAPAAVAAGGAIEPGGEPAEPAVELTIREKIEAQVAAEAFRERRRVANYRRPRRRGEQD